ncbi:hypothetical protein HanPI659440_Chr13g0513831 [Helianthus annuus]|nr:hypothetical protein HanIR_Chr16g0837401 [Helianthus annuus]KAJ0716538.1 hypothetical protein HanPI659440_Chr13g0513831 [Helianthus annuus]
MFRICGRKNIKDNGVEPGLCLIFQKLVLIAMGVKHWPWGSIKEDEHWFVVCTAQTLLRSSNQFGYLDLELHSKYVHIALEGQPTIVVDDLFVVDHFILNAQTTRVAPLFI